jgi:hypothetical protein
MNVLTESINLEFVRVRPILTAESIDYVKGENIADVNIVSPITNYDLTSLEGNI